jgi:hypothetical protein
MVIPDDHVPEERIDNNFSSRIQENQEEDEGTNNRDDGYSWKTCPTAGSGSGFQ